MRNTIRSPQFATLTLLFLFLLAAPARAQFTAVWNSTETENTNAVAWGDYDGDGDLDQLVGNWNGQVNRVYRNDGGGVFTMVWNSTETDQTYAVAWGDYDGDGDLDQLVGNQGANRVYRNDGGNVFTLIWSSTETEMTRGVAWGDYDGDGDLDQLVGNEGQTNRVYRNDGGGAFTAVWNSTETELTEAVTWGDYDGDGDLDQLIGNGGTQTNRVYRNDGGNVFTAVWNSTETEYTNAVAWGDYDGDGDIDQLVGNGGGGQTNRVYRNDGGGVFTAIWNSAETEDTRTVAWGDYDGDGDLDQLIGNFGANRVYRNDGAGVFTAVWNSTETEDTLGIAWGDYDGDGDIDQLVGNWSNQTNRVYQNTLVIGNTAPTTPALTAEPDAIISGATTTVKLQWSASTDAITPAALLTYQLRIGTTPGGNQIMSGKFRPPAGNAGATTSLSITLATGTYYWSVAAVDNTGFATSSWAAEDSFVVSPATFTAVWNSTETETTYAVAWGDYDGDGDLDQLVGNSGQTNRVYRNDGGGVFTTVWNSVETENTKAVAWGDYDGDGDLDQLIGNIGQTNRVYRNDGGGSFTAIWNSTETEDTFAVAWGDYDNDGDLDQLIGNYNNQTNRVYRNDGGNIFTAVWNSPETESTQAVAWGDYDGDGDLDQLVGNYNQTNRIYRNDGGDAFTMIWNSVETENSYTVAWGDYDGDGDLDQLVGNSLQTNRIYRNDGGNIFTAIWNSVETDETYSVAWGDYDGDGDLDQLIGNWGNWTNQIYRNDGGSSFTMIWNSTETENTTSAAWGDYDGDGDIDQLAGNENQTNRLYRNDLVVGNVAPSTPALTAEPNVGVLGATTTVQLQWSASTDALTPAALLTYQLRIGNTPGGNQIMSGKFRPPVGNAGATTTFNITLATGTYYWSVAAVDNTGFTLSSWAAEDSFLISNDTTAPTVTDNQADVPTFAMSDPGAIYDVDFYDTGGSNLKTAQYTVWSAPGGDSGTGTMILNWTNIATGINTATYTTDWGLNFASLSGGINYVSVRAFDYSNNLSAVSTDVFYMNKYAIFTDSGQALGSYNTRGIAIADTNNDGLADFFEGNNGQASRMWMNNGGGGGAGVFADSGQTLGTFNTMAVCAADVDRNTYPDFIQGNYSNQVNRVWTISAGVAYDSGQSLGANYTKGLFAGDFDNDGSLDLAVSKTSGQFTEIWKNNGSGTFTNTGITLGGTNATDVKGADLNGDGYLDLAVSHGTPGGLPSEIWMNNGMGGFTNTQSFGNSFSERIALTDIDSDGDMDMIMSVTNTAPKANKVWQNNGSGVFTDTGQALGDSDTNDVAAGDVDNDGDMDFIDCNNPGQASGIWLNNGTGSFTDSGVPLGSAACASIALADIDGDYDLDAIEGVYGGANKVWINNALTANTPPPAPTFNARADAWTELGATTTVRLNWNAPASGDDHTPGAALTYDVRVGTSPSGCEVLCSGGLGVGPGNAGATTSLLINLASGTYYWSLRAVDSAYIRSSWSAEDAFDVIPDVTPPSVTDNQTGDTTWRFADPGAVYDVDFSDSFSGLKIAQYSVWSAPGESAGTGSQIIGWATIAADIGAASYTTNWGVNFASLSEGLNYVSVRASDNAKNVSALSTDAFYISKDTQPPAGGYLSYSGAYFTTLSVPLTFATGTDYSGVATWSIDRRSAVLNVGQCGAYGSWGTNVSAPAGPIFNDTSVAAGNCYQYRFNNSDALGFATSACTDGAACAAPAEAKVSATAGALSCSTYGDLSQNGQVNIVDAAILKQRYGTTGSLPCLWGDLNADNAINTLDVTMLSSTYLSALPAGTPEFPLSTSAAALTLSPSPAYILSGGTLTVNVILTSGAAQIDGADIHLSFATSTLSFSTATAVLPSGFTLMVATGSNNPGGVTSGGSADISLFRPSGLLTGYSGSIATVVFNVISNATTTISFVKSGPSNRYTALLDNGDYKDVTTTDLTLYYDQTPPVITDNQTGDDTWRTANPGAIFNIDISDSGGSNLNSALYTAYTGPGMTGTQSLSWTSIASGINASSYTTDWGVNFASLANGINYITVRAFDYAGNASALATDAFYVKKDLAAPVFSGLQSASAKAGTCGSADLSWNAATETEGNGPVTYNIYMASSAGAENYSTASYQTSSTSLTITGLADGVPRYFVVRAADTLGNMDANTTEKTATPTDITPPTVTDNQPGDDLWYSTDPGAVFDVDFSDSTCAALSYAKYSAYGGPGMSAQIGTWATIAQNINSASYTANWGVNFFALPDGISYIAVYAAKSNGPVSTATEVFYIKKDTTAPTAPGTINDGSGIDASFATNSAQLSANWSAAADPHSGISAYWHSIGTTAGASDTSGWTSAATATSVTKTGLSLVNGQTYYFTVKAENGAGLFSQAASSNGARAALNTPSSSITNPKASSTINTLSAVSGTATDNSGSGLLYTQISIMRTSDGLYWSGTAWQAGAAWLTTSGAASWLFTAPLPAWQNGVSYQIQSRATDNAAHVETPGAGVSFTFDTAAPAVAITSPVEGAKLNSNSITVSGTVEAGASVTVNGAAASVTSTTFSATVTPSSGGNVITAIATDAAGNSAQHSVTVSVDSTAPAALIMTPANGATVNGTVSVTGTASDINFSSYTLEYGPGSSPSAWKPFASGTAPVSASVLGSTDMSALEGVYKIRLTANDSYGNTSTTEAQITVSGNKLQRNIALNPNEWTIAGMPLVPDAATLAEILDPAKYKIYWWNPDAADDPVNGKYQKPSAVSPGQAFWMKSIDKPMSLKLKGSPVNSAANYEYQLKKGWNQIATPFNWPSSWQNVKVKKGGTTYTKDEAVALSLIESTPFDHNVAGWKQLSSSSDAQMHPGYGYFIYAPADGVSLVYAPGAEDPRGVARIVRAEPEFNMNLSARTAAVADEDNIISMAAAASDKYDPADLREPPGNMDKYISLYFPHADWAREAGRYANDARGASGVDPGCSAPSNARACKNFNFNIDTNDRGTVTLTWTNPSAFADKYTITLNDLTAAASVDMAAQADYQYPGGSRSFRITVVRKATPLQTLKRALKPGWNLVSIPLETQSTNAIQQLGDDMPAFDIYQYFDKSFSTPAGAGGVDLQNGVAYWIYSPNQSEIDIEGSPADTSGPVITPIKPGWNLIGDPYAEPVTWGDNVSVICGGEKMTLGAAAAAGRVYGSLYKPVEDGSYERLDQGGTLQPWDGYLLKSQRDCALEFRK